MTSPAYSSVQLADRFELLVDAVDEYAIFMLETDGTVASWNAGAQRIKGYTAEEIIGKSFTVFYSAADLEDGKPARELAAAVSVGQHRDVGWRVRKDSSTFWANVVITAIVDADGELKGFAKVTRDETDRKRADELSEQIGLMSERNRIAIELQETVVGQILRAILRLTTAASLIHHPEASARIDEAIGDLDATLKEIRDVITDLHPAPRAQVAHPTESTRRSDHQLSGTMPVDQSVDQSVESW
jgi:PAS domain S-box-containing protein